MFLLSLIKLYKQVECVYWNFNKNSTSWSQSYSSKSNQLWKKRATLNITLLMQMDKETGTIMDVGNTTAALTTQPACVIISHTLEFFWYKLLL